jgi:hypothetical protein
VTTFLLFRMLARRWYVVVAVFVLTGLAYTSIATTGGAYAAQADVVFVAPGTDSVGGFDERYRDSLVHFAEAVEREYHGGRTPIRLGDEAPLFGTGIDQGEQVLLPNTGSQWQVSYDSPRLSVDVVGPDPQWVRQRLGAVLDRVEALASERQQRSGVADSFLIRTDRAPREPVVEYVGSSRGAQVRALIALVAVSAGFAATLVVLIDRVVERRTPARHPTPNPSPEGRVR